MANFGEVMKALFQEDFERETAARAKDPEAQARDEAFVAKMQAMMAERRAQVASTTSVEE